MIRFDPDSIPLIPSCPMGDDCVPMALQALEFNTPPVKKRRRGRRPKPDRKATPVAARLPRAVRARLAAHVALTGQKLASFIRAAVEEKLNRDIAHHG